MPCLLPCRIIPCLWGPTSTTVWHIRWVVHRVHPHQSRRPMCHRHSYHKCHHMYLHKMDLGRRCLVLGVFFVFFWLRIKTWCMFFVFFCFFSESAKGGFHSVFCDFYLENWGVAKTAPARSVFVAICSVRKNRVTRFCRVHKKGFNFCSDTHFGLCLFFGWFSWVSQSVCRGRKASARKAGVRSKKLHHIFQSCRFSEKKSFSKEVY